MMIKLFAIQAKVYGVNYYISESSCLLSLIELYELLLSLTL